MSLKKASQSSHGTLTELNITPLLDLVFVLLVIFIITTPQLMNNLEMALPSGQPAKPRPNDPKPKNNRITLEARGRILLNDEEVAVPALRDKLAQLKRSEPDLRVVVKADDDVSYQNMVNVLDTLQRLEITKVGLATDGSKP